MKNKKFIRIPFVLIFCAIIATAAGYFSFGSFAGIFAGTPPAENVLEIAAEQSVVASDTALSVPDDATGTVSMIDTPVFNTVPRPAPTKIPAKSKNASSDGPGNDASGTSAMDGGDTSTKNDLTSFSETLSFAGDAVAPSSSSASSSSCAFPSDPSAVTTTKKIVFNEIAWMGSASSAAEEWMELKNDSGNAIDLVGWKLSDLAGRIKINFAEGDTIPAGGFLLLVRSSALAAVNTGAVAKKNYMGELSNVGDELALEDPQCGISDYLDAMSGWPGGDNKTKATLERGAKGIDWHTSASPGGTPGAANSAGPPPPKYTLTISFSGAGGDTVTSDPQGLSCGENCSGTFTSGTKVALTPVAGPGAAFDGWSGPCYGETVCSLTITQDIPLTANFRSTLPLPDDSGGTAAPSDPLLSPTATTTLPTTATTTSFAGSVSGRVLLAAIQIAGTAADNDLVKLHNPTGAEIDMSGWKLRKRSKTGADYSLKTFPEGSAIAPGGSFTWANGKDGFADSVGANVSSSETISADNSIALIDAQGAIVDAVAWGTGSGQYGEGSPYPTDPAAGQLLARRSSGGLMADTDNNASDFTLQ